MFASFFVSASPQIFDYALSSFFLNLEDFFFSFLENPRWNLPGERGHATTFRRVRRPSWLLREAKGQSGTLDGRRPRASWRGRETRGCVALLFAKVGMCLISVSKARTNARFNHKNYFKHWSFLIFFRPVEVLK